VTVLYIEDYGYTEDELQSDMLYSCDRFREVREGLGWSQEELADKMNISVGTVYRAETGRNATKMDYLFRMMKATGAPANRFLPPSFQKTDAYGLAEKFSKLEPQKQNVVIQTMTTLIDSLLQS
jgi:transcriptional regulator with XRE-family HTH domain